jgi:hypothetical protein
MERHDSLVLEDEKILLEKKRKELEEIHQQDTKIYQKLAQHDKELATKFEKQKEKDRKLFVKWNNLNVDFEALKEENKRLLDETKMKKDNSKSFDQIEQLKSKNKKLKKENKELRNLYTEDEKTIQKLKQIDGRLAAENAKIVEVDQQLANDYKFLTDDYKHLTDDYKNLQQNYHILQEDKIALEQNHKMSAERNRQNEQILKKLELHDTTLAAKFEKQTEEDRKLREALNKSEFRSREVELKCEKVEKEIESLKVKLRDTNLSEKTNFSKMEIFQTKIKKLKEENKALRIANDAKKSTQLKEVDQKLPQKLPDQHVKQNALGGKLKDDFEHLENDYADLEQNYHVLKDDNSLLEKKIRELEQLQQHDLEAYKKLGLQNEELAAKFVKEKEKERVQIKSLKLDFQKLTEENAALKAKILRGKKNPQLDDQLNNVRLLHDQLQKENKQQKEEITDIKKKLRFQKKEFKKLRQENYDNVLKTEELRNKKEEMHKQVQELYVEYSTYRDNHSHDNIEVEKLEANKDKETIDKLEDILALNGERLKAALDDAEMYREFVRIEKKTNKYLNGFVEQLRDQNSDLIGQYDSLLDIQMQLEKKYQFERDGHANLKVVVESYHDQNSEILKNLLNRFDTSAIHELKLTAKLVETRILRQEDIKITRECQTLKNLTQN